MRTSRYRDVATQTNAVLGLGRDLGLEEDVAASRFAAYVRNVERLAEAVERSEAAREAPKRLSEEISGDTLPYLVALVEAAELADTAAFLAACDPDIVKRKLR